MGGFKIVFKKYSVAHSHACACACFALCMKFIPFKDQAQNVHSAFFEMSFCGLVCKRHCGSASSNALLLS